MVNQAGLCIQFHLVLSEHERGLEDDPLKVSAEVCRGLDEFHSESIRTRLFHAPLAGVEVVADGIREDELHCLDELLRRVEVPTLEG